MPQEDVQRVAADDAGGGVVTKLTNPGILERVLADVETFTKYGFAATLLPGSPRTVALTHPARASVPPAVRVQIPVRARALIASVGPLLRTLVRVCMDPVDPSTDVEAVVDLECEDDGPSGRGDTADAAARAAHDVHMLIRNSMGAALFLRLSIILPGGVNREEVRAVMAGNPDVCYPSIHLVDRATHSLSSGGASRAVSIPLATVSSEAHAALSLPAPFCLRGLDITKLRLRSLAQPDSDACPPAKRQRLQDITDTSVTVALPPVSSRMCTVRLTPVVYYLAQALLHSDQATVSTLDAGRATLGAPADAPRPRIIVVCIDKVANLHRVLMLARDYVLPVVPVVAGSAETVRGARLMHTRVVVATHGSDRANVQRLEAAASGFFKDQGISPLTFGSDLGPHFAGFASKVVHTVCEVLAAIETAKAASADQDESFDVAAIDLHDAALTLHDLPAVTRHTSRDAAGRCLSTAGVLMLGFERNGLPQVLQDAATKWVQLPTRSSLNVVATLSVILHVLWGQQAATDGHV
eukprot:TRINITY_DN28174_c0_g1_i1.p1 TRINITY_DN28174_c0_g1~~TRINITY_DN28174_c0_g1_i1.p1  ORF type:complete len:526 (+),score=40.86 TRINITY_DN28174_c0_g1_i1:111-1688(+)